MNPLKRTPVALALVPTALVALALAPSAPGQSQSLSFVGGVLLNAKTSFGNLGAHPASAKPGAPTGGAVDRTYDDGFNRVDASGNERNTTVYYGYRNDGQVGAENLVLSASSAPGNVAFSDVGEFILPSGFLEYRGSLGPLGKKLDWGMVLGVGYQTAGGEESGTVVTDADRLEDRFSLNGFPPRDFPAAPYNGTATGDVPRIGSVPSRTQGTAPGARVLSGTWELDTDLIPITGGFYLEGQLAGSLNGIVSAGVLAMIVNADFQYREVSTMAGLPPVTTQGGEGAEPVLFGGFVQLGLDWALWEKASLVASARWQPTESFDHSVDGRTAEIDFTAAFAVHAGFAFRF